MQASPIQLLTLLGDSKTVFRIPAYQRRYEWNLEHLNQYFNDIERILDSNFEKSHFLGTIVYVQNELPKLIKERVIIDGQQRITTTLILLKAIMDLSRDENILEINPDEIKDTYLINRYATEETKNKLRPVDGDLKAYEELMNCNKTDSKIYTNYKICIDYLKNSKYSLVEIYNALGYIDVVYISLDKNENPQIIFESLNSTGLSLTEADLIRNFILMGLNYNEQTRLYKEYWMNIEKILPNKVISDFVRDFLTMKEGIVANKNKVYETFKNYYYVNNYNSEDILEELLEYSKYYYMISNSSTSSSKINTLLDYINNIRNTVSYPYILSLFGDYYKNENEVYEKDVIDILTVIVSYIYRRNICNIGTNALNKIFASMTYETKERRKKDMGYKESVIDYLMSRSGTGIFPRDEEFKNNFLNNDLYTKANNVAKVILHSIEKEIHKEAVDIDKLTIEHILPQTLNNEWNIELGRNSYEIHRVYRNTIGNLTLTNYNSEISNKGFTEKKEYYKDSNVNITRDLTKYNRWTDTEILERAENLFEIIKRILIMPEDRYQNVTEDRLVAHEQYSIKDNLIVTGYTIKCIIIDNERYNVNTWKDMLVTTSQYLYDLDEDLFKSLVSKPRFKNMLSYDENSLREAKLIRNDLFIQTHYGAKDILSYVVLLCEEYGIDDLVYFEVR